MSDVEVRIAALNVYPVKSCAGVALGESLLVETGFEFDRAWMVVDADARFVTQRELPRMALIRPVLKTQEMVLRAPGMLALH
ncbi:MOSC domain-containing protein, partial [Piscinibacter sp.]|uniref:MOSC domain-containing protein n=1 Tax=Piscinibacter sp. TaxID=1903157 RepID=UPI002F3EAA46